MAKTTTFPAPQTITTISTILLPSQAAQSISSTGVLTVGGTDSQLIFTASSEGSILKTLRIASNDINARYVSLWVGKGSSGPITLLGTVPVPATSGLSATGILANVDILGSSVISGLTFDNCGRPVIELEANSRVYLGLVAQLTSTRCLFVSGESNDMI